MNNRNKHIKNNSYRAPRSFVKTGIVLCFSLLFIHSNLLKAQVISNTGASISITSGTVVESDTVDNQSGNIDNDGIINLSADYKNAGTTHGDGNYNIAGDWTNTGVFNCENSTVHFNGDNIQNITSTTGDENFHNLKINNSGISPNNRIVIANNVNVSDTLSISQGNVITGVNKLYLSNQSPLSLEYLSITDSRVIGKFERGISSVGNYLFPIGTADNYNPINIYPNETPGHAGSVLSEFIESDPGSSGLPLPDDSVEVYQAYDDGYWNLISNSGYSCEDYNINFNASGFVSPIHDITRVMRRSTGNDWEFDGVHKDANAPVAYRDSLKKNISSTGTDFGLGHCRPLIWVQPSDIAVCDGEDAFFMVVASGRRPLTYQWQENQGSGWNNISDGGIYSGTTTAQLDISPTNLIMTGYLYRVIISDFYGTPKTSDAAELIVNPLPIAFATPMVDTICNNATTYIKLTSDVPETSFSLEILYSGNIENANLTIVNDTIIQQTLTNPTDTFDYVEYRIIPKGPNPTDCPGTAVIARVYVEPTPRAIATIVPFRICNDSITNIILTTPTEMTSGVVTFDYSSAITGGLTGNSSNNNLANGYTIEDTLHNPTFTPHTAKYTITPRALTTVCADGPAIYAEITVHPTPYTYFDITNTEDSVTCNKYSDAYAQIIAENGIGEFDYEWSNSQTSDEASGLSAGWYTVTVTDNIGCIKTDSILINEPDTLYSPIGNLEDNICFNYKTGFIRIDPTGGNGGYNYLWSTGATTDSIGGLGGAWYNVTVTDYKGCVKDTSILITEQPNPLLNVKGTNISCHGNNDGSAKAILSFAADSYLWSTGETTQIISGLTNTMYYVTVAYGECYISKGVQIEDPPILTTETNSNNISCAGDGDGYINLTVEGGTLDYWTDYIYSWSPGGATSQNPNNLSGGMYYVTVQDENGCTAIDSAVINEPPDFISNINPENVRCFGENNGTIELIVTGGNGTSSNFGYEWSNGSTNTILNNLAPDNYVVTITDSLSCIYKDSVEITEPDLLTTNINSSDISCFGYNNGYAVVNIFGGNGGNSIIWQPNNETTDSIYNLAPDEYSVSVTDSKGCNTSNSVEIKEPEKINVNPNQTDISCYNSNDGIISLNPSGGIYPYTFIWNHNPLLSGAVANNLSAGNYLITVTDNNNCEEKTEIEITQPEKLETDVYKTDVTCFGFMDGSINLNVSGGTEAYQYQWSNNDAASSISMLDKGNYTVTIEDAHNCSIDTLITIEEPDILAISPILTPSFCPDVRDGSIELNISGGNGTYNIYWDMDVYGDDLYNIHSGNYKVAITDENLCRLDSVILLPSIYDICIEIPNAFTPNNDLINDKWEINMFNLYPNVIVEVFDRYGKKVFYSTGYEESQYWDGTYNGKELPMDSYYYIIYLQNGMKRLSGVISIIK